MNTHMVPFHGHNILALDDGGIIRIVMKPICELLGLDWRAQRRRISNHPALAKGVAFTATPRQGGALKAPPHQGGVQEMLTLTLNAFHGWLVTLTPSRIKDDARRDMLIHYQEEAFEVIAAHFSGSRPSEQHADMTGWDVQRERIAMIRETRLVFGRAAAARTWREIGLPLPPSDLQSAPDARSHDPELIRQLHEFIEECCERDSTGHVAARPLFLAFDRWQMRNGQERITESLFGRLTIIAGLAKRSGRIRTYPGLRLKPGMA